MNFRYKKLLAKEILAIVILVIVCSTVYFGFIIYDRKLREKNAEISSKIENINSELQIKTDSLSNFRAPLDLTEALKILKPWEKFDKDGKPKFNPNEPYDIYDKSGIKKKINSKNDSLQRLKFKKQIVQLAKQRKLFESELTSNIDVNVSITKSILLLLVLVYPVRFLILGAIWSMKILKKKEN